MYNAMLHAHSGLRWVVMILLLLAIFRHLTAGDKPYGRKNGLLLTIFADIMLLIGIYLWLSSPTYGLHLIQNPAFSDIIHDKSPMNQAARFLTMEHAVSMLIAIILLHIGKAQGKKALPDRVKHRRSLTFYVIALLLILAAVPWPFITKFAGRGWV
jgi:hypothetical protein